MLTTQNLLICDYADKSAIFGENPDLETDSHPSGNAT
jgi:hypothetical protein